MGAAPRERIPKRVRTASVRNGPAGPAGPCAKLCRLLIDPRRRTRQPGENQVDDIPAEIVITR